MPKHNAPSEQSGDTCLLPIGEEEFLPADDGKLLLTIEDAAIVFRDVPTNQWFARYVATIIQSGIASGYKDASGNLTGLFGPENSVTYAEIAKMGLEMAEADIASVSDKPRNASALGQWSEGYIRLAEDRNFSVYIPSLNVNAAATRGAVIQTILEAIGIPIVPQAENPYTDLPGDHPYADAILTATTHDIVHGDTDAAGNLLLHFRPDEPVNRAETAKILTEAGRIECAL